MNERRSTSNGLFETPCIAQQENEDNWTDLQDLLDALNSVWIIEDMSKESSLDSTRTCRNGQKNVLFTLDPHSKKSQILTPDKSVFTPDPSISKFQNINAR